MITCFFSVLDLEAASPSELLALVDPLLADAGVPAEHRRLSAKDARVIEDDARNRMFSLTFVVGVPDL